MPNPTTTHDDEQLDVEQFRFIPSKTKRQIDIYFVERGYGENFCDSCLNESEATKLVAMIMQVFPQIREQIKESKP